MLDDVTAAAVRLASSAAAEGVFRAFRPGGGAACAWVALPAWAKLQEISDTAVALQVGDTKRLTVAPLVAATPGPALLIIDRSAAGGAALAEHFYIVAKAPSALLVGTGGKPLPERLELAAGGALPAGAAVVGRLALVVRPPLDEVKPPRNLPPGLRDLGIADGDGPGGYADGDGTSEAEDD